MYRTIQFFMLMSISQSCLSQGASIEFIPQSTSSTGYEILEYTLLPDSLPLTEEDKKHMVQHRLFVKVLSNEWLKEKQGELSQEEQFVATVVNTHNSLIDVTELESLLDELSYARRVEDYETSQNQIKFDRFTYSAWLDMRPFAMVRYGNVYLIVCDVKIGGLQDSEFETEVFKAVYQKGEYRLTDALDRIETFDSIANSYLSPQLAEGSILTALRERASIE